MPITLGGMLELSKFICSLTCSQIIENEIQLRQHDTLPHSLIQTHNLPANDRNA